MKERICDPAPPIRASERGNGGGMGSSRQEIHNLMAGIVIAAKANPLPQFCPEVMAAVLVDEMEKIWPLMSPESKVGMALVAATLQHRHSGVVATTERTSRKRWWNFK